MKCPLCKEVSKEVREEGNLVYVKCMNKDCKVTVYESVSKSAWIVSVCSNPLVWEWVWCVRGRTFIWLEGFPS